MVPLSFGQQRLWFLDRVEGTGWTYNVVLDARLRGELDVPALAAALRDLLRRHDVLRTVYPERDGAPRPEILPVTGELDVLTVLDEGDADAYGMPDGIPWYEFDLTGEVPLRAFLQPVGERHHVLYLAMHHIVVDGWSIEPLLRDIGRAYAARRGGRAPDWEPLPVQYADFAQWQRDLLGSADDPHSLMAEQLDFWGAALNGLPAEIPLPADRPRPASPGFDGGAVAYRIDAASHRRLLALARESRATLFMVVQTAVAALFSRLGAGDDIPLGTAVAGRADEALDELVGFFVNTVVLRTDVSGDPTFRELLARVRTFDLAAFDHQEVPFEKVVERFAPARVAGRHPLFQSMLTIQSDYVLAPEFPGLEVRTGKVGLVERRAAKFDLYFDMSESWDGSGGPAGISGELKYATDLWDHATAEAMAQRLLRLLTAMAADPDTRVGQADVLSAQERRRLTAPETGRASQDVSVAELFARRAALCPDTVVFAAQERPMTCAQLDREANRLAHHLQRHGLSRGDLVGIELEPGADLAVAQLAVWKAGAAWVTGTADADIWPLEAVIGTGGAQADSEIGFDVRAPEIGSCPTDRPATRARGADVACLLTTDTGAHEVVSHRTLARRAQHGPAGELLPGAPWWAEPPREEREERDAGEECEGRAEPGARSPAGGRVLDQRLEPVPPGVTGDLYLPGDLPGYGWYGEWARTAAEVVADPYGPPGARMVRTGRRARHAADGTIELLPAVAERPTGALPGPVGEFARTPRQEILCGVFAEMLGLEAVGLHEDFFELGGQSLLAARVAGRIRSIFGLEPDLSTVFRAPTVARLDALLGSLDQVRAEPCPVADRPERLPLSPAQLRLWMLDQIHGPNASYNIPVALRLRGAVDAVALEAALNDVVARHEALRTILLDDDGEPYQHILPPERARITVEPTACAGAELTAALDELFAGTFKLAEGPLIRAHLVSTGEEDHVLLLVIHHIVCDGASQRPLLRDLGTAYEARRSGRAPDRPSGELQYADCALWQREILGEADDPGSLMSRQLEYWQGALAGLPGEATLPPDRHPADGADPRSGTVTFAVDAALHRALARLAGETGTTLFMTLHAGLAATLNALGVGDDIPLGTAVAGRGHEALDGVVGFFTNTVPLRADVSGDPGFVELLGRLRRADLDAFAHQDVPFDQVVQRLNPRRVSGRNPLFQIGLALERQETPAFAPEGVEVEPVTVHGVAAKLDLDLTLTEHHDERRAPAGLTGALEYPAARYDRATAEDVVALFTGLLAVFAADPGIRLSAALDAVPR